VVCMVCRLEFSFLLPFIGVLWTSFLFIDLKIGKKFGVSNQFSMCQCVCVSRVYHMHLTSTKCVVYIESSFSLPSSSFSFFASRS
jgi:hypothetical protein